MNLITFDEKIESIEITDVIDIKTNTLEEFAVIVNLLPEHKEIILTKENLQYLLDEIKKEENYFKENGIPSYVDED